MTQSTVSAKARAMMEAIRNDDPRLNYFNGRDYSHTLKPRSTSGKMPHAGGIRRKDIPLDILLKALNDSKDQIVAAALLGVSTECMRRNMRDYGIVKVKGEKL